MSGIILPPAAVTAAADSSFVDSIGINTHIDLVVVRAARDRRRDSRGRRQLFFKADERDKRG
jgi:hypothetical protein